MNQIKNQMTNCQVDGSEKEVENRAAGQLSS